MMRTQPIIRVCIHDNSHVGSGGESRQEIHEMAGVPRIGETFYWDGNKAGFTIHAVLWVLNADYDVQIRGW